MIKVSLSIRLAWLDLLRAIAIMSVLYAHMVGQYLELNKLNWFVDDLINSLIFTPLAITQNGGFFGVTLFFLISGYIVTQTSLNENRTTFAIKRIMRIYPLLIIVIILFIVFYKFELKEFDIENISIFSILSNVTLLNYILVPQIVLIGVAWSLVVEVLFYSIVFFLLPLIKSRYALLFPIVLLLLSIFMTYFSRSFGQNFFLFSVNFIYIPILGVGSVFYLFDKKLVPFNYLLFYVLSAYISFLVSTKNFYPDFLKINDSYPISITFAFLIFVITFCTKHFFKPSRFIEFLATHSYSLYLIHGFIGIHSLRYFQTQFNFLIGLGSSLIICLVISILTYRFIEKPCNDFAKNLTKKNFGSGIVK